MTDENSNEDTKIDAGNSASNTDAGQDLTAHQKLLTMLPEDLRTEPMFKNFDGETIEEAVGKMAKSYVSAQKLIGADKDAVLKLPSSEDDKDGWNAIYEKLGRPESPDKYDVGELSEKEFFDKESFEEIKAVAHEAGVSNKQLQAIIGKYAEQIEAQSKGAEETYEETFRQYDEDLRKEWGQAYEQKANNIQNVLRKKADPEFLKIAAENPMLVDHPSFIKTIDNIIAMTAEDGGMKGGTTSSEGRMTPDEARASIKEFDGNPENQKIMFNKGDPRREELLKKRARLFEQAYSA